MCVGACVCVLGYVLYACVYVHVCACTYMSACVHACKCMCMCELSCVHTYRVRACVLAGMHVCVLSTR